MPAFTLTPPRAPSRRSRRERVRVVITAEAIAAAWRVAPETVIVEAIREALPSARNISVDLGSIRLTHSDSGQRVATPTPRKVRQALLALRSGHPVPPFRFLVPWPRMARAGTQ